MIHIHSENCQDLKAQLSEYIDGELDDAVCQEIERHMADCENCRIVVDTLRKTVTLYRAAPAETVPPAVHARLVHAIDLEFKKKEPAPAPPAPPDLAALERELVQLKEQLPAHSISPAILQRIDELEDQIDGLRQHMP